MPVFLFVLAGIFFELIHRRYASATCNFLPGLAKALLENKKDNLENMPYNSQLRTEMFYAYGLLYEKRGNTVRIKQLFQLCIDEDPTYLFPRVLAEKKR
jgi:hypothetical protein